MNKIISEQNKPDYKLHISITSENYRVKGVLCEVYLPKRLTDPVELCFLPAQEQLSLLDYPFEFSVYGEIKDLSGNLRTIIKANRVYYKKGSTRQWEADLSDTLVVGEPVNLTITDLLNKDDQAEKSNNTLKGTFWLTPSAMLSPMSILSHSFTGETTVKTIRSLEFTLSNGLHLKFGHHYKYFDNENGETISFPELVAEFEAAREKREVDSFLEAVDDFLALTSFAARQRCVCLGWDSYDSSQISKYFRRDVGIPQIKKDRGMHDGLIEFEEFRDYISGAYRTFVGLERKDLIRQAIHRAIGREGGTLESNYLILYSALETLVLFFQQQFGSEFIICEVDWAGFRKKLEGFIREQPQFSGNKDRRKLIYQKLPEINRVSFSAAFNSFARYYNIDLSDLWPVVDRKNGISLADIRNKLIHGDTFGEMQGRALIAAREHLRWVVERSLLSVLGWEVSKSKVSKEFLSSHMTMYKEWQKDRKILSESA